MDGGTYKYPQPFALSKCASSLSHRHSAPERGFSINCYLLDVDGHSTSEKTQKSLRLSRNKICCVGSVLKFPVSRNFISSIKGAHAKYVADIDARKERKKNKKI